jgi:hypothetical protein
MDEIFLQNIDKLKKILQKTHEIGIVVDEKHSLDKLAAGLSLYLSLRLAGKKAEIISKTLPIVEFSNLVGIDEIKESFTGNVQNLTISLPYHPPHNEEIEKVSYKIEDDRLNINIIASEGRGISIDEKDIVFLKQGNKPSLIFGIGDVDSADYEDVNTVFVPINTQPANTFSQINFQDENYASVSEITTRIIAYLSLPINIDIAQNLMDGIVETTSDFTSPKTSAFSFEAASVLMRYGAKRKGNVHNILPKAEKEFKKEETAFFMQEAEDFSEQDISGTLPPQDWFTPKVFKAKSKD